jgi:hypothetical protein
LTSVVLNLSKAEEQLNGAALKSLEPWTWILLTELDHLKLVCTVVLDLDSSRTAQPFGWNHCRTDFPSLMEHHSLNNSFSWTSMKLPHEPHVLAALQQSPHTNRNRLYICPKTMFYWIICSLQHKEPYCPSWTEVNLL